jgi:hypothetical protein
MEIRYANIFVLPTEGKRLITLNINLTLAGLARGHIMCIFNTGKKNQIENNQNIRLI